MIPALALILGLGQHTAQGTTLAAMVLPIGILAALEYYKNGHVNVLVALLLAAGFVIGGYLGAKIAVGINEIILRKIFGFTLLFFAARMILGK